MAETLLVRKVPYVFGGRPFKAIPRPSDRQ